MPSSSARPSSPRLAPVPAGAGLSFPGLALWGTLALSSLGACASSGSQATREGQLASTVEKLRAENAAYARKVEELENQVFILGDEAAARRAGEPPPPVAVAPPPLPEVKLAPGGKTPEPEGLSSPESLVDETVVEYSGAAADRRGKRPLLRLWGPAEGPPPAHLEAEGREEQAPATRPRRRGPAAVTPPLDPPAAPTPASARPAPRAEDRGMVTYRKALALVQARRHDEAVAALRAFVKDHADHDYADNAQYWLGECFYDRRDFSAALREFTKVWEHFPQGNKVPDALLKTAFSYLALGSLRPGRETLQQIVQQHPTHPAAGLAAAKMAELDRQSTVTVAPLSKEKAR